MFLERISKFPRIINVGDMHVRARDNQTTRTTVTADVTATTFVLAEQPKPARGCRRRQEERDASTLFLTLAATLFAAVR